MPITPRDGPAGRAGNRRGGPGRGAMENSTNDRGAPPKSARPKKVRPAETAWRAFCRAVVEVFYRRCEVEGLENIPATGPVLLCANHPSALVDAVVIQAVCPRLVHPLARSGLFRNPLIRPMLALIQAVPIHRRQDTGGDTSANVDAFATCYRLFAGGEVLLIFPEGLSHADPGLRGLKTGAARLALGALEANGVAPLVLPVGLNFSEIGRFRSSVFIKIAKPLPVQTLAGESAEEAVHRVTGALGAQLGRATLDLDSWEEHRLLRRLERFFALRQGKIRRRSLGRRFRAQQKLTQAARRLRVSQPERLESTMRRLGQFERLCQRFGVRDYHLSVTYTPALVARFILRTLAVIFLALPVALWGALNSFLPYLATGTSALLASSDRYQYDTAKISFGMLYFGLCWGGQTWLAYWGFGLAPALLYGASLPPSAALALYVRRERGRIMDNIKAFFVLVRHREVRALLENKRTELERELADLTRLAVRAPEAGEKD